MATHDYVIDNSTGANVRADINNVLQAVLTNNSNSSSPSTTAAYMLWVDTTANIVKIRNSSNNAWINLFTTAGGVDVDAASNFNEDVTFTGANYNVTWDKSANSLIFNDNAKAVFGTGSDFEIKHTGSNSQLIQSGTGDLFLDSIGGAVSLRAGNNAGGVHNSVVCNLNTNVELYYDNSKKLETTSAGVTIEGSQHRFKGDVRFDNNTNADKDIYFDESENRLNFFDDVKATFGNSNDLQIYHSGSGSFIVDSGTGDLHIRASDDLKFETADGSETYILCNQNGEVQLFYDNNERLNTSSAGVFIHGTIGSTPPDKNTRGMSLNSYVVDINQDAQTVSTAKINALKGVALDLNRFYTSGNILDFRINNDYEGGVTVQSDGVSYTTTSDYRLKENEVVISDGITRLKQLKAYKFNFIAEPSVVCDGFFAHEVTPVVPRAVQGEKDATEIRYYEEGDTLPSGKAIGDIKDENSIVPQTLDYSKIVPLLTAALQESVAKIEVLETKVAALEAA